MNADLKRVVEFFEELAADHKPTGWPAVRMDELTLVAKALRDQEAEIARLRKVADLLPTSWLDPMLTGPDAVIGKPPYNCPDIERLLRAMKARITAHLGAEQ